MREVALVLASVLVLAGCIGAAASTQSAGNLDDTARDRADEELDDPQLIGLWGVETPAEVVENGTELRIELDDNPGDGQAAGWAYRFLGEERSGIVVVADTVGVVAEYWEPIDEDDRMDDPSQLALDWDVDSEEAAETLQANDTWPTMTDAHALEWDLEREDNRTVWNVEATQVSFEGEDTEHHARVDAQTGQILDVREDAGWLGPGVGTSEEREAQRAPSEGGCNTEESSGEVTPLNDVSTEPAELPAYGSLALTASYQGAGPLDVEVLDESGDTVFEEDFTMAGSGTFDETLDAVEPGEYSLAASTGSGSAQVSLTLRAVWGGGFQDCEGWEGEGSQAGAPSPALPAWIHADRSLGVNALR